VADNLRAREDQDPEGKAVHEPGAKLDDGKPWTTTVMHGFWDTICDTHYWEDETLEELAETFFKEGDLRRCLKILADDGFDPVGAAIEVGSFGARKYTRHGWQDVKDGQNRYSEAAGRHLYAALRGEENDVESGLPHLSHFAWNLYAILTLERFTVKLEITIPEPVVRFSRESYVNSPDKLDNHCIIGGKPSADDKYMQFFKSKRFTLTERFWLQPEENNRGIWHCPSDTPAVRIHDQDLARCIRTGVVHGETFLNNTLGIHGEYYYFSRPTARRLLEGPSGEIVAQLKLQLAPGAENLFK
jgi:hypothetical protein